MNRGLGARVARLLMGGFVGASLFSSGASAQLEVARQEARVRAGAQEWVVVGKEGPARHNEWWTLRNLTTAKPLVYQPRPSGINLSWGDSNVPGNVRFVPQPADSRNDYLRTRRPVAIQIAGGGFLKYGERENGINLVWSAEPAFEWEIRVSGLTPRPVETGTAIGLYNRVVKKSLVYCPRDVGINLRWDVDCSEYDTSARADVRMRVRVPSGGKCSGTMRVKFEPFAVAGRGKSVAFVVDEVSEDRPEYPSAAHLPASAWVNPADWYCHRGLVGERLAAGVWRVSVEVPSWRPNPRYPRTGGSWGVVCTMRLIANPADLLPRMNASNLRVLYDRQSCGVGNTYPH